MAEPCKKKPRKSKIELRKCNELEDKDAVEQMQGTSQEDPLKMLPKLKSALDDNNDNYTNSISGTSKVEFSIQVEVENCDDEISQDREMEVTDTNDDLSLDFLPNFEVIISNDAVLEEVDKLYHSKNYSDRKLAIGVRNIWGRHKKTKNILDYHQSLVQNVLHEWKLWATNSKLRTSIFAYKCYICSIGFWHLGPFEEHIKVHSEVTLKLEPFHQECCIVAAQGQWFEKMCLCKVEGPCPKCLASFEEHSTRRKGTLWYHCDGCNITFSTCWALFMHEGNCIRFEKLMYQKVKLTDNKAKCNICDVVCVTETRYQNHIDSYHTARSDMPQQFPTMKPCPICGLMYYVHNLHDCPRKKDNLKCQHCKRRFQTKVLCKMHEQFTKSDCYCKICKRYFKKQCMETEHVMKHSKNFVAVYKCMECMDNVLLAEQSLMIKHCDEWHRKLDKKKGLYDSIIVPRSCMTAEWSEGVTVEDMIITSEADKIYTKSVRGTNATPKKPDETNSQDKAASLPEIIQRKKEDIEEYYKNKEEINKICAGLRNKMLERAKNIIEPVDINAVKQEDKGKPDIEEDNDEVFIVEDVKEEIDVDDDDAISEMQNSVDALLNIGKVKEGIDIEEHLDYVNNSRNNLSNSQEVSQERNLQASNIDLALVKTEPELEITREENFIEIVDDKDDLIYDYNTNIDLSFVKKEDNLTLTYEEDVIKIDDDKDDIFYDKNVIIDGIVNVKDEIISLCNHQDEAINIVKAGPELEPHIDEDVIEIVDEKCEDGIEISDDEDENVKENDSDVKKFIAVKQEKNYAKDDIDIVDKNFENSETESKNEMNREECLEEITKVLKAPKNTKSIELTGIRLEDVSIKEEPIDDDCENDIIRISLGKAPEFHVTASAENVKSEKSDVSISDMSREIGSDVDMAIISIKQQPSKKNEKGNKSPQKTKKIYRCKKCRFLGLHKEYVMHRINCVGNKLTCTKCNIVFEDLSSYFYHFTKHNLEPGVCPVCFERLPTSDILLSKRHFTCHIQMMFRKIQVLNETSDVTSKTSCWYQCKDCSEKVEFGDIFFHWEAHFELPEVNNDDKLVIDEQNLVHDKNFTVDDVLPDQIKKVLVQMLQPEESDRSLRKCVMCDRKFMRRNECKHHLIEHLLRDASVRHPPISCQLCKERFTKAGEYRSHMRNHAALPMFRCEMCNKCFSSSSNFAKHKKIHNVSELFSCDICSKKFHKKFGIKRHMELYHKNKDDTVYNKNYTIVSKDYNTNIDLSIVKTEDDLTLTIEENEIIMDDDKDDIVYDKNDIIDSKDGIVNNIVKAEPELEPHNDEDVIEIVDEKCEDGIEISDDEDENVKENDSDVNKMFAVKQEKKYAKDVIDIIDKNFDNSDTESETEVDHEACLEEISKVFKAPKNTKSIELTGIRLKDVKIKEEPIDDDDEDDIIRLCLGKTPEFDVTVSAENVKSEKSDVSTSDMSREIGSDVDMAQLEPKISIKQQPSKKNVKGNKSSQKNKKIYRCMKCQFVGLHKEYRIHKSHCRKPRSYEQKNFVWTNISCTKCNKFFEDLSSYFYHFTKHNLKHGVCPVCFKHIPTSDIFLVKRHLECHIKKMFRKMQVLNETSCVSSKTSGFYQCNVCSEKVKLGDFFCHWEAHFKLPEVDNDDEDKLVIDEQNSVDNKNFTVDDVLPNQIKKVVAQMLLTEGTNRGLRKCVMCDRKFMRRNDCKRHLIEHLLRDASVRHPPISCQLCKERFRKPDEYRGHMRNHAALPMFRCEMCKKCFSDSSNFAKHKKVHNVSGLFECDICSKKFHSKRGIERHIQMHLTTEPIQCPRCDKLFYERSIYKKHVKTRHDKPPFTKRCNLCRAVFDKMKTMWDHMWEIHRERRVKADCPLCSKSFRKYQDVRNHVRRFHNTSVSCIRKGTSSIQADDVQKFIKEKDIIQIKTEREEDTLVVF